MDRTWYWVLGVSDQGKGMIAGAFESKEEAEAATSNLNQVRVVPLPTRDRTKALPMLRRIMQQAPPQRIHNDVPLEEARHRGVMDRIMGRNREDDLE